MRRPTICGQMTASAFAKKNICDKRAAEALAGNTNAITQAWVNSLARAIDNLEPTISFLDAGTLRLLVGANNNPDYVPKEWLVAGAVGRGWCVRGGPRAECPFDPSTSIAIAARPKDWRSVAHFSAKGMAVSEGRHIWRRRMAEFGWAELGSDDILWNEVKNLRVGA